MFGKNNSTFETKSLNTLKNKQLNNRLKYLIYLKYLFVLFLILGVFYFWGIIFSNVGTYTKNIIWGATTLISKSISKPPSRDSLGNFNILILGIGGKNHDGGYLTDTIMIGSFNYKLKTLTFLSIPRDLYVKYDKYKGGRINYIFAEEYLKTKSFDKAAIKLSQKIKQITGIETKYYVVIDFSGFKKFINLLGGISVYVPYTIIDYKYPAPNWTYTTFKITKGFHKLDGETALKYVRSRHSTSDFSRSARQEQVIKAIIQRILSKDILFSPIKLKTLYFQIKDIFKTNLSFENVLSFISYADDIKIHSYVLNGECFFKKTTWENLMPGCFVYPASRDAFNGQAVLLPVGATPNNVEVYEKIKKFTFIALGYPEIWLENAKIQILNGINRTEIKKKFGYLKPLASKLAYKLKNYGFNIQDVGNASKFFNQNTLYIYNKKTVTENLLTTFVGFINFKTGNVNYIGKGYDFTLILGKNYLENY